MRFTNYQRIALVLFAMLALSGVTVAQESFMPGVIVQNLPEGGQSYSLTLQILALMTMLTL